MSIKQQIIQQKNIKALKLKQQKDTNNKDNKRNNNIYSRVIEYLNEKTGKKFKTTEGNIKWIKAL